MTFHMTLWTEELRDGFAAMNRDRQVMADLGGPIDRAASDAKFDRHRDAWALHRISRWALTADDGRFLGYCGVMKRETPAHPLGVHFEIGWRLCRDAWGRGIASESARRALNHAWGHIETPEIFSYTAPDNLRSQKVMARLGLMRDPARDFTTPYPEGIWTGLVWVAERPR